MKIKKRSLLTVFLALLCAVAFAVGLRFALPDNAGVTAKADTVSGKQSTFASVNSGSYMDSINDDIPSVDLATILANSSSAGSASIFGGVGTLTGTVETIACRWAVMAYGSFSAEISDVPAYTEYKVEYTFNLSMSATRATNATGTCTAGLLCFGNNTTDGNGQTDITVNPALSTKVADSSQYSVWSKPLPGSATADSGTPSVTVIYTNNTSSSKTYKVYFAAYAGHEVSSPNLG